MNFLEYANSVDHLLDLEMVMIDNETMGTASDAPIIAIGATVFTLRSGASQKPKDRIYIPMKLDDVLANGAVCSGDTISWWMEQSEEARSKFFQKEQKHALSCEEGLLTFHEWFSSTSEQYNQVNRGKANMLIWGNGPTFDCGMLAETYARLGLTAPWQYYNEQCMRTMKTLGMALGLDPKEFARIGTHHAALDDALFQSCYVSAVARRIFGVDL